MSFRSRIPARRILQGGVTFAAFGALSIVTAVPAHAENGEVGYAHTNVAGEAELTAFYPRGGDIHGTYRYLDAFGGEVFAASRTSVLVDVVEDELVARAMFEELRVEFTEADVEAMRAAVEDGVSQPGLENSEGGSDELLLQASFTGPEIAVTQNWAGEREFSHDPGTESVEVNEIGAEISFSTETAPWHETLENQSLVYQGLDAEQELWGGVQTLDMVVTFPDEGFSVSYEVGEIIVASDTDPAGAGGDEGTGEDEDTGDGGGDGETDTGDEPGTGGGDDEPGAGDEGDTDGEGDGATGGEGDPGKGGEPADEDERDAVEEGSENESEDALARTGSPIVGLVAAGAAIAAGGGAAAYLARRRKTASAASEESDEG
ncbi:hypothetical protein [Nocardiopsis quinghaiensis]|uniref:hypothetical protein n=1 Tax=Nocardiopsis quinghaiensis TaxID=464995 RepID=UPI001CC24418|nr:hypothetical protein [Nocardiopsis quinghaiensis]